MWDVAGRIWAAKAERVREGTPFFLSVFFLKKVEQDQ
jgi:hypothetical protein